MILSQRLIYIVLDINIVNKSLCVARGYFFNKSESQVLHEARWCEGMERYMPVYETPELNEINDNIEPMSWYGYSSCCSDVNINI